MNLGIEGRQALVVGGSKGIGLEIVRELKSEGCRVISVSRSEGVDLMPPGSPESFCREIQDTPPDIIVHVLGGSQGVTDTLSSSLDYGKVWRLNLGISIDINDFFLPMMQRNKWGRIVHITSNATRIGTGYAPYTSAKGALEGYVKVLAREVSKDGVIVSAVAPGIVHTPGRYYASLDSKEQEAYFNKYIPANRFGRAEEVAKVVSFLASQHSAYMAGSIVQIDGGAR